MSGKDAITICYFGECAVSDGDFHVSLNIATMIDCPVMFYRQNNGYAMSMPSE
jgi:2-oxoisovalerate dehydrogenase E1 component alpha subunit